MRYKLTKKFAKLLHILNPFSDNDTFDRYANFVKDNDIKSAEEIFIKMQAYYPPETCFGILSMDFEYMEAGYCKEGFFSQLNDLELLKKKLGNKIYPFIAVDPRRPNLIDIVKDFIEVEGGKGIKIYPALGFYPFDERLYKVYDYAEKNQIPVVAHCSKGGIFFRGKISEKDLTHPKTGEKFKREKNKYFVRHWSNPKNYYYVLNNFPNLILDLAHFGGEGEWVKYSTKNIEKNENPKDEENWLVEVLNLLVKFPNVYTDIAYSIMNDQAIALLKIFLSDERYRSKILFGSDFYMDEIVVTENHFSNHIKAVIGIENFNQMAIINNRKFLNIN